ncbi:hypothetical protein J2X36_002135 [Methylobacterium sp. BE186]|uniref:hypothetical protein n=1 Tax=Methylobacterium sp. BE186 TaxID=2817715 RepID=UPI002855455E|nr:hypothetical protein [Methylobacterium sp. BE186]MDR7037388.1 hypothetical protein [Methylobacterium sp. BE186]
MRRRSRAAEETRRVLNLKILPRIREALDASAEANGRTLSSEVEHRLSESLGLRQPSSDDRLRSIIREEIKSMASAFPWFSEDQQREWDSAQRSFTIADLDALRAAFREEIEAAEARKAEALRANGAYGRNGLNSLGSHYGQSRAHLPIAEELCGPQAYHRINGKPKDTA